MNTKDKAAELGITPRRLRQRCEKEPGYLGSFKSGDGEYIFPDGVEASSLDADLDRIPTPENAKELKDYFQVLKNREDFLKARQDREIQCGKLVRREELDQKYIDYAAVVRNEIEKLPDALKLQVELSARAHAKLQQLCDDLLDRLGTPKKKL